MNDVAIFNRPSRGLSKLALAGSTAQVARVSLNSNRFTLIDDQGGETLVNSLNLQVVIFDVAERNCKTYYDTAFNPADTEGPACLSEDGIRPDPSSPRPQADACVSCPQNVWGSAVSRVSGAKIKACSDGRKVAVLVGGHGTDLYQLRIPPASLKAFAAYARSVGQQKVPGGSREADLSDVITSISFVSQGVLGFEVVGNINADIARLQEAVWESGASLPLIGKANTVAALPAPKQAEPAATFAAPVEEKPKKASPRKAATVEAKPEPFFQPAAGFGTAAPNTQPAQNMQAAAPMKASPSFGAAPATASSAEHAGVDTGVSPDRSMQALLDAAFGIDAG